jgi:hypothetical protein
VVGVRMGSWVRGTSLLAQNYSIARVESCSLGDGFNRGAVGGVLASKALESAVLVALGDVHKSTDGLDGLLGLLDGNLAHGETGLHDLLDAVVLVVSLVKDENSSEVLLGGDAGGTNREGGGGLGSAVEAGHIGGSGAERVAVELDEVGIVSLGKGPNNAGGGLHI